MDCSAPQRDDNIVKLLTGVQQQLTRYVRALVPNRADCDEVLQETNLFVWRHADEFEPGTNFAAWACKIAWYQVLSHRKRQARSRLCFSDALVEQLAGRGEITRGDDVDAFESCVAKLSEQDRKLIDLRYEPGATVHSVAQQVGRSTKAVYNALGRIRGWLLDCVQRAVAQRSRQ